MDNFSLSSPRRAQVALLLDRPAPVADTAVQLRQADDGSWQEAVPMMATAVETTGQCLLF